MKKISALLLALVICIASAVLIACKINEYTVIFKNGEEVVSTQTVKAGECVTTLPTINVPSDKRFDGWFVGENEFTAATPVMEDTIVLARISDKPTDPITPIDEVCTLILKLDADTVYDTVTAKLNAKVDLYDYSAMDYEIHEWADESGRRYAYNDIYTMTGNATLTAVNPIKLQFTMQLSSNGDYYIATGLSDISATAATIPSAHFGLPVKEIASGAFAPYNNTLKSLTVPNSIEKIGKEAFSGLYGLTELTVPFVGEQKFTELYGNGEKGLFAYWFSEDVDVVHRGDYAYGSTLYYNGSSSETDAVPEYATRQIPKSLVKVNVNGGVIANFAFHTIATIETINLGDEVTALGEHAFGINPQNTYVSINDFKLKEVICTRNSQITSIGEGCFNNQVNLTKVCLPPKVTVIREALLRGFEKLTEFVIFDNSELEVIESTAFYGTSIKSVSLPETVTTIGTFAFGNCLQLEYATIRKNAVNLGEGIFRGCSKLVKAVLNDKLSITELPAYMFDGCLALTTVELPQSITKINDNAFSNCKSLRKADSDETFEISRMTYIGNSAFNATSIDYIEISADITYIGSGAFASCNKLMSIEFLNVRNTSKLTEIKPYTFDDCSNLKQITLPDSITKIGVRAFSYTGLITIKLPQNLRQIDDLAFYQFYSEKSSLTEITDLGALDNLTSIGNNAFENNDKLTISSLPQSVKYIGEAAFRNTGINSTVTIDPAKLEEIGAYAFANCMGENAAIEVVGTNNDIPRKWDSAWAGVGQNAIKVKFTDEDEHYVMLSNGFEYYEENGVYFVTKYIGESPIVVLDDTFANVPVVYNQSVFAGNSTVTHVTIAPSMTAIPKGFFADCQNLSKVTVPEQAKLTSIGDYAFRHCRLESFTVADASELTYIGDYAFYGNSEATHITLEGNNKIKHIGNYAFKTWFASSGTDLLLLDLDLSNAEHIGDYAFADNTKAIAQYSLTSSVKYLGVSAFAGCKKISLTLKDGFTATRFENGVFNQVGTLIWETMDFNNVEYIGDGAFSATKGSLSNAKLHIPDTVKYIGVTAFSNCGLIGATIDCSSELIIGDNAFSGNPYDFWIIINGIPKQIGGIDVSVRGICSMIDNAHIYFTETIERTKVMHDNGGYHYEYVIGGQANVLDPDFDYCTDESSGDKVPFFGAGEWTTDKDGNPIHPNDGHTESKV